jgi:hypothetical protein
VSTRRTVAAALGVSALVAGAPTAAHADPASKQLEKTYEKHYRKAEKAGAHPGRNIVEDGVREHGDTHAASEREVKRSLRVLKRMVAPAAAPGAVAATGSTAGGTLSSIAACESGGDPSAVDASGTYRGKYQFDQQTWESVGGTGDPAAASEAEQDARAQALMAQRGTSAWPVCGS